jgi:hypothetical protein
MGAIFYENQKINKDNNLLNTDCMTYRGNNLGTVTSSTIGDFMKQHGISKGYFTDLYVGDYFTAKYDGSNINFRIMDIDPYYDISDSGIAGKHHILIVPDKPITTSRIGYSSNGYAGTYMYKTTTPKIDAALKNIFGDYLLSHKEIITTSNSKNYASYEVPDKANTTTVLVKSILMSIIELYGKNFGFESHGMITHQLLGFKYNPNLIELDDDFYYIRDSFGNVFFIIDSDGEGLSNCDDDDASVSVRPRFLLG